MKEKRRKIPTIWVSCTFMARSHTSTQEKEWRKIILKIIKQIYLLNNFTTHGFIFFNMIYLTIKRICSRKWF